MLGISSGFDAIRFIQTVHIQRLLQTWRSGPGLMFTMFWWRCPHRRHTSTSQDSAASLCFCHLDSWLCLPSAPCEKCVISLLFILRNKCSTYSVFHTTSYLELFTIAKTRNLPTLWYLQSGAYSSLCVCYGTWALVSRILDSQGRWCIN